MRYCTILSYNSFSSSFSEEDIYPLTLFSKIDHNDSMILWSGDCVIAMEDVLLRFHAP